MSFNIKTLATAALTAGALFAATVALPVQAQAAGQGANGYRGIDCAMEMWRKGCPPITGDGRIRHHHRHHNNNDWRFGIWFDPGPWYYDPVYPYASPYYDDQYHVYSGMTCNAAAGFLRSEGYRKVYATDCEGKTYGFTASKHGHKYKIKLNKYSGRYSRALVY